jgi:hypothetical protein
MKGMSSKRRRTSSISGSERWNSSTHISALAQASKFAEGYAAIPKRPLPHDRSQISAEMQANQPWEYGHGDGLREIELRIE